jgi:hypothetical protein
MAGTKSEVVTEKGQKTAVEVMNDLMKGTADTPKPVVKTTEPPVLSAVDVMNKLMRGESVEVKSPATSGFLSADAPVSTSSTGHTPDLQKKLEEGMDISNDIDNYYINKAHDQSFVEQSLLTTGRMVSNFLYGAVSAAGSTLDMIDTPMMLTGVIKEYGNILGDAAKSAQEWEEEKYPIYKKDPNTTILSGGLLDPGWWGNIMVGVSHSAGIWGESVAATLGAGALTGPTGYLAGIGAGIKAMKSAKGLSNILKVAKNSDQIRRSIMLSTALRGMNELQMEGVDSYHQVYKGMIDKGMSHEEAVKYASVAAANTARLNLPKVALDLLQAKLLLVNPMSGSTEGLLESFLGKLPTKIGTPTKWIANMGGESFEEYYQAIAQNESVYKAEMMAGLTPKTTLGERLKKYNRDGNTWDAAFSGAVGGLVLGKLQQSFQKWGEGKGIKDLRSEQEKFVQNMSAGMTLEMVEKISQAVQEGKPEKAKALLRDLSEHKAITATHLDALTDRDTAFNSYMTYLDKTIEAAEKGDMDALEGLIVPGMDLQDVKERFKVYREDALAIKELYDNNTEKHSREAVVPITRLEYDIKRLGEEQKTFPARLAAEKANIADYDSLSTIGKQLYDLHAERAAKSVKGLPVEDLTQAINTLTQTLTPEQKAQDQKILNSISWNNGYTRTVDAQIANQKALDNKRENLILWKDSKYQEMSVEQKDEKLIRDAKSLKELDAIRIALATQKRLTQNKRNMIGEKRKNLLLEEKDKPASLTASPTVPAFVANPATITPLAPDAFDTANTTNSIPSVEDTTTTATAIPSPSPANTSMTQPTVEELSAILNQAIEQGVQEEDEDSDDIFDTDAIPEKEFRDKMKTLVKKRVEELTAELGHRPSFTEFFQDFVDKTSEQKGDQHFEALKTAWLDNGYPKVNFDAIRNAISRSKVTFSELLGTLDQQSGEVVQQPASQEAAGVESVLYDTKLYPLPEGHKNRYKIDDFTKYKPGTKLSMEMMEDPGETITIWDQEQPREVSLAKWVAESGGSTQDYVDDVPILVKDESGEPVATIPQVSFFKRESWGRDLPESIREAKRQDAINNVRKLRTELYGAPYKKVSIEITERNYGTMLTFPGKEKRQVSKADPTAPIGVKNSGPSFTTTEGIISTDQIYNPGNTLKISDGHKYEFRKMGEKNGKPFYWAQRVHYGNISQQEAQSVYYACASYIFQDISAEQNPKAKELSHKIKDKVKAAGGDAGMNIHWVSNLETYISQFVDLSNLSIADDEALLIALHSTADPSLFKTEEEKEQAKARIGKPYIITQHGTILFGRLGQQIQVEQYDSNGVKKWVTLSYLENNMKLFKVRSQDTAIQVKNKGLLLEALQRLLNDTTENGFKQGMTKKENHLKSKIPVSLISRSANNVVDVTTYTGTDGKSDYASYLKDTMYTVLDAVNVGTKEEPRFVSMVNNEIKFKAFVPEEARLKAVQKTEQVIAEEVKTPEGVADMFTEQYMRDHGYSEEAIRKFLSGDNLYDVDLENYKRVTDEMMQRVKKRMTSISDLDSSDRQELINYISRQIEQRLDGKNKEVISREDTIGEVTHSFENIIQPKMDFWRSEVKKLKEILAANPASTRLQYLIDDMELNIHNVMMVRKHWKSLMEDVELELERNINLKIKDFSEESYSKTAMERDPKSSVRLMVKRFLSRIPRYENGYRKIGFLGVESYPGFDYYFDLLGEVLSPQAAEQEGKATNISVRAEWDDIIARLKQNQERYPWIKYLLEQLETAPQQLKIQFTVGLAGKHNIHPEFVMISKHGTGVYLRSWETNYSDKVKVIRRQWESNSKDIDLFTYSDGEYRINIDHAKYLLGQYQMFLKRGLHKLKEAQEWLSEFGINLSMDAMEFLKTDGYTLFDGSTRMRIKDLFPQAETEKNKTAFSETNNIFKKLASVLTLAIAANEANPTRALSIRERKDLDPFAAAHGLIGRLASVEARFSLVVSPNAYRDSGKNIYAITQNKLACQQVEDLIRNDESGKALIDSKLEQVFDGKSMILKLMKESPEFAKSFQISHISLEALKEERRDSPFNMEVTRLSDADKHMMTMGFMQSTTQGSIMVSDEMKKIFMGIPVRMARMLLPTMSDKELMLEVLTAILAPNSNNFRDLEGNTGLSDNLLRLMYSQMVEPELDRIIDYHIRKARGEQFNQKDYDKAAQIFHFIPEMNNVTRMVHGQEVRVIEYLQANAHNMTAEEIAREKQRLQIASYRKMEDVVTDEVTNVVHNWFKWGFAVQEKNGSVSFPYMDKNYVNDAGWKGTSEEKLMHFAYDYVVNNMLTNANHFMMFAGDVANFGKANAFSTKDFEDGNPTRPLGDGSVYRMNSENIIGRNVGKRLAMLIAPGDPLFNSENDNYIQLFLEDAKVVAPNAEYMIDLHYEGKRTDKVNELLYQARNEDDKKKSAVETLSKMFPDIASFFSIENTDSQEMMTAGEALNVAYRRGNLSEEKYKELKGKIRRQRAAEKEGKPIAKADFISHEDINLVFQPQKPVYTGYKMENGRTRMVYIKTSAISLLPQLTGADTQLYGLRRKMEEIEDSSGRNVRAVYVSGAKIGSPQKAFSVWKANGDFKEDAINVQSVVDNLNSGNPDSALILPRKFFRIQQDIPFKSHYKEEDLTKLGTQMMKTIFGNGVSKIKEKVFSYKGEMLSGEELYKEYNSLIDTWIKTEKTKLYRELGVDELTGKPKNMRKFSEKLHSMLLKEARKRDYPLQDQQALGLDIKRDDLTGEVLDVRFTIPLWLTPNSNRYESLLNSIVGNRMLNLELPGVGLVTASSQGFKWKATDDLTDVQNFSDIIWRKTRFNGELRAFDTDAGTKAQILVPSKFRGRDGKLIDLLDPKNGYFYEEGGRKFLNEDRIKAELLESTSFRIPTSGHVSIASVEIVGFLPPQNGDIMVVPPNFLPQKGLDFDVDKEYLYNLWHALDEEDNIVSLEDGIKMTYQEIEMLEKNINDQIESMRDYYKDNQEMLNEIDELKTDLEVRKTLSFDGKESKKAVREIHTKIKELKEELLVFGNEVLDEKVGGKYWEVNDNLKKEIKKALTKLAEMEDYKTQFLQNDLVRVYSSVMSTKDKRVQRKINKVLSMDFVRDQASYIEQTATGKKTQFSMLTPGFQTEKMKQGAAGNGTIGVYSNFLVVHGLSQQTEAPLRLMTKIWNEEKEKMETVPYSLVIGKFKSDGYLGRGLTLDGARDVSSVYEERQQTSLDNENEGILGRVGVSMSTINVDCILVGQGYDRDTFEIGDLTDVNVQKEIQSNPFGVIEKNGKAYREVSIPYLLLSQPLVKKYIQEVQDSNSITRGYEKNKKRKILEKLIEEYGGLENFELAKEDHIRRMLTGENLARNLEGLTDNMVQLSALGIVEEIERLFSSSMTSLQQRLNIQGNELGISNLEARQKYKNLFKFNSNFPIQNASKLVGDYLSKKKAAQLLSTEAGKELIRKNGFIILESPVPGEREVVMRPTSFSGSLMVYAPIANKELWDNFFPYKSAVVEESVTALLNIFGGVKKGSDISDKSILDTTYLIMEEMKKYLNSSEDLGTFSGDPQMQRARLTISDENNVSLPKYMRELFSMNKEGLSVEESKGLDMVKNNKVTSRLFYNFDKGAPSTLKFDNNRGEDSNESYKYQAIVELLEKNLPLPAWNKQPYTTRQLGIDLISYAYLEGGVQKAIQYIKYISIPVLEEIGYATTSRKWQEAIVYGDEHVIEGLFGGQGYYSNLAKQVVQHNPGKVKYQLTKEQITNTKDVEGKPSVILGNTNSFVPEEFSFIEDDMVEPYATIYNELGTGRDKLMLFQWDMENSRYTRIPTFNYFGMSQYSMKTNHVTPLTEVRWTPVKPSSGQVLPTEDNTDRSSLFELGTGDAIKILDAIAKADFGTTSFLASYTAGFVDKTLKIDIVDETKEGDTPFRAVYNPSSNTLRISRKFLNNHKYSPEEIAYTIMEEMLHSVMSRELIKYFDAKGKLLVPEQYLPPHILRLHRLLLETQSFFEKMPQEQRDALFGDDISKETRDMHERELFVYTLGNIHEFVAKILAKPHIREAMSKVPYKKTNMSLLERFYQIFQEFLEKAGMKFDKDTVAFHAVAEIFSWLEQNNGDTVQSNSIQEQVKTALSNSILTVEQELENRRLEAEEFRKSLKGAQPTVRQKKEFIVSKLENGEEILGTIQQGFNGGYDFVDKKGSRVRFYNHSGNITQEDYNKTVRLVLAPEVKAEDGKVFRDVIQVWAGDKFFGNVQETDWKETPAVDLLKKIDLIETRIANGTADPQEYKDLDEYRKQLGMAPRYGITGANFETQREQLPKDPTDKLIYVFEKLGKKNVDKILEGRDEDGNADYLVAYIPDNMTKEEFENTDLDEFEFEDATYDTIMRLLKGVKKFNGTASFYIEEAISDPDNYRSIAAENFLLQIADKINEINPTILNPDQGSLFDRALPEKRDDFLFDVDMPEMGAALEIVYGQWPGLEQELPKEKYMEWVNTIWPDSYVKRVVYHGTGSDIEKLEPSPNSGLIFFAANHEYSAVYAEWRKQNLEHEKSWRKETAKVYDFWNKALFRTDVDAIPAQMLVDETIDVLLKYKKETPERIFKGLFGDLPSNLVELQKEIIENYNEKQFIWDNGDEDVADYEDYVEMQERQNWTEEQWQASYIAEQKELEKEAFVYQRDKEEVYRLMRKNFYKLENQINGPAYKKVKKYFEVPAKAKVLPVLLNVKNPQIIDEEITTYNITSGIIPIDPAADAIIGKDAPLYADSFTGKDWKEEEVFVIKNPDQIYYLGSPEDIAMAKQFANGNKYISVNDPTLFSDNVEDVAEEEKLSWKDRENKTDCPF